MGGIPELPLQNGKAMIPVIGLGTASFPPCSNEATKQGMLNAIRAGYRHFDTAALYGTEQSLGQAISEALSLDLIKSRDELFITSKLWCTDAHHDRVLPAIHNTLKNLRLEYLDLYLIHFPVSVKSTDSLEHPPNKRNLVAMDFKAVWESMEECQKLGLTKSIGVSNFSCKKLEILLSTAKIPPAVNQVEMNPLWRQNKIREFCEKKGIVITAYSPLGANGASWGNKEVMECEVLKQIANAKGKTLAQVCLRWVYEQGVSVVVKSFNKERIQKNIEIFEWELSSEELNQINQLPQNKGFPGLAFIAEDGPYKSLDEFWDGEI